MITARKLIVPIVLGLVFFALLALGYSFFNEAKKTPSQSLDIKGLGIEEDPSYREDKPSLSYYGQEENLPKSMLVNEGTNSPPIFNEKEARKIANKYGFSGKPTKSGNLLIWKITGKTFIANMDKKEVTYSVSVSKGKQVAIGKFVSREVLDAEAGGVAYKLGISEAIIDFDNAGVRYSSGLGMGIENTSSPKSARIVILDYPVKSGETAVYGADSMPLNFQVTFNSKGKLMGFKTILHRYTWRQLDYYPLKSVNDSLLSIKDGGGTIVSLTTASLGEGNEWSRLRNKKIEVLYFDKVKVGYFAVDGGTNYLVPVYIFSGEGSLESFERVNVTLFDLAIQDKFISN
jgi:hypothetical protein